MDALEALGNHHLHALQLGALRGPVSGATRTVLLACQHNQGVALLHVLVSGIEERQLFAGGDVDCIRSDFSVEHLVCDPRIREGAAGHNLVISAAGAVLVEIFLLNSAFQQVAACWRVFGDVSGRRNMVGGDRITEDAQAVCIFQVLDLGELDLHGAEEGGLVDVGRFPLPLVLAVGVYLHFVPAGRALGEFGVVFDEHLGVHHAGRDGQHLLAGGPDVPEEDVLAVLVLAQGLVFEVELDRAGDGEGHHQGGRGQVVRGDLLVHAGLEVAVAGEGRDRDQVILDDGLGDLGVKIARVTWGELF